MKPLDLFPRLPHNAKPVQSESQYQNDRPFNSDRKQQRKTEVHRNKHVKLKKTVNLVLPQNHMYHSIQHFIMPSIELQTMAGSQNHGAIPADPPPKYSLEVSTTASVTVTTIVDSEVAASAAESGEHPPLFTSILEAILFITTIGFSQFLVFACYGNTAFSAEVIGQALGATDNGTLTWFLLLYALATGVCIPVAGRLGDHFGHKFMFMFGCIVMGFMLLINGWALSIPVVVGFRAGTGIGAAMMVSSSLTLIDRAFLPGSIKKNIAFALQGFCAPVGYIFGGLIGAAFAHSGNWPWAFWFWAIAYVVLTGMSLFFVPHDIGLPLPDIDIRLFDTWGSFFGIAALTLLSIACRLEPVAGFDEINIAWLVMAGETAIGLFWLCQHFVRHPILPPLLWERKGFVPVVIALGFG